MNSEHVGMHIDGFDGVLGGYAIGQMNMEEICC